MSKKQRLANYILKYRDALEKNPRDVSDSEFKEALLQLTWIELQFAAEGLQFRVETKINAAMEKNDEQV